MARAGSKIVCPQCGRRVVVVARTKFGRERLELAGHNNSHGDWCKLSGKEVK